MKKFFTFMTAALFAVSMFAETVTLQYPKGTTTNMVENANNAALVGLDDSYFTVTSDKGGGSNQVGLNKDGTIRLYAKSGDGTAMTVSMVGGLMKTIKFTFANRVDYSLTAGGTAVEVVTGDQYEINATSFTIKNISTLAKNNQVQIKSIDITCEYDGTVLAKPVISPDVLSFEGSLEVTISAAEGASIFYTLDESTPTTSSTQYTAPFTITQKTTVKAIAAKDEQVTKVVEKTFYTVDTISVTEARALIDAVKPVAHEAAHYVRGVVKGNVMDVNDPSNGKLCIWMTDEVNSTDSLEAFQIYGGPNEQQWTLTEAKELIGDGDTIMVYAPKLTYYSSKKYYETDGGYYVKMLGKYQEDPTIIYDTLTVEQAKAAADALPDNGSSEKKVYVEGFAKHVAKYDALKGNQTFFMADVFTEDIDSTFEAYLATPKKEGAAYPVLEGDKVRAFGYLKKYIDTKNNNKVILEITDPLVSFISEVEGDRTIVIPKTDTISVEKALEIGAALDANGVTEDTYVIEGYISEIENYFTESGKKETFWMASTKGSRANTNAAGAFYVYGGVPTPAAEMGLEAHIYVTTKIKKYQKMKNGQPNGSPVIESDGTPGVNVLEAGLPEEIESITVARALEIGGALTAGNKTDNRYEITGWVSAIEEHYSTQYGNETFWIHDTEGSRAASNSEGAFEIYQCKPSTGKEIGIDAKIKIVCKIKKHTNGVIENNGNNIEFEVLEQGHDEQIDTLTVEEAVALGKTLAPSTSTSGQEKSAWVVVKGFAVSVKAVSTEYNNQDWYMSDDPDEEKGEFKAHQCSFDKEVVVGDYMYVLGRIVNYGTAESSTIEISRGTGTHGVAPVIEIEEVTVAQALAIGEPLDIDEKTSKTYAVTGYIALIREDFDEDTQTMSALLSDDPEAERGTFFAEVMKLDKAAEEHEKVRVVGKIMKQESASGNEIVGIWNGKATRIFPESIEEVVLTEKAQKVMIDGVMYIVRDNKLFDVRGTRVR